MMTDQVKTQPCLCGCGDMPVAGKFLPGHDAKLTAALTKAVGGIECLRMLVEDHIGRRVVPDHAKMEEGK